MQSHSDSLDNRHISAVNPSAHTENQTCTDTPTDIADPGVVAATSKFDRQVALEKEMQGLGQASYRKAIARAVASGDESSTPYARSLIKQVMEPMARAIAQTISDANTGKPGRRHAVLVYLEAVPPMVAALITSRIAMSRVSRRDGEVMQRIAAGIGSAIEDEVRFRHFAAEAPQLYSWLLKNVTTSHVKHRRKRMVFSMNAKGVEWEGWSKIDKMKLGMKMIELFIEATGLLELRYGGSSSRKRRAKDTTIYVAATEKVLEWINESNARSELLRPMYLPTIIPPRPWAGPHGGGYHTKFVPTQRIVKVNASRRSDSGAGRDYMDRLKAANMSKVYASVNAVQGTGWKINTTVLGVMRRLWDIGRPTAGLPLRDAHAIPPSPLHPDEKVAEISAAKKVKFKAWKRIASQMHSANAKLYSRRFQAAQTLWVADRFADEETIYFPCNLDFRGRLYAIPGILNPQGDDMARGLLTFSEGKKLGDDNGVFWLAVHGANTFGNDKINLHDRAKWASENTEEILKCAEAPIYETFWTKADKPWQFLAFCFEWARYIRHGYDAVSHLPISVDGTCNGIQHFSAMLRDEKGAKAVNLTPSATPQDIYKSVADAVIKRLKKEAVKHDDKAKFARRWLAFGITRSTTKRQVMILPYGGTMLSCREYTRDHVMERLEGGQENPFTEGDEMREAISYLASHIWASIGSVVVSSKKIMDWLTKCARQITKENMTPSWVTPAGLPIEQMYWEMDSRRVETKFGGNTMTITMGDITDRIAPQRHVRALSPNFVHSMDAAHLMLTVVAAKEAGVSSFLVIHDTYGAHAADMDCLAQSLREAFVDMYQTNNVLRQFQTHMHKAMPASADVLPDIPEVGNLDLSLVLKSPFFFA